MAYRTIKLRYMNEDLQIGMVGLKEVYLLSPTLTQLQPEVYRGKLVYRAKGSSKRISYQILKKGLKRCSLELREFVPNWL